MSEITIERACEILNESKWRGRDDWRASGTFAVGKLEALAGENAIAIAQGILDRKRVIDLEAEQAAIRQGIAIAEQPSGDTSDLLDLVCVFIDHHKSKEHELAALRKAVKPFEPVAREILAGNATDPIQLLAQFTNSIQWFIGRITNAECRALLATEQKEGNNG